MKIALLHLSDIHFRSESDPAFARVNQIVAAATSKSSEIDAYLIVATGDIANWGLASEYSIANSFLSNIYKGIADRAANKMVEIVVVPGNHDCDLVSNKNQTEIRDAVLQSVPEKLKSLELSGGLVQQCVSVQDNFFDFMSNLPNGLAIKDSDRILYSRDINVLDKVIRFLCFNTAWISKKKEIQGTLLYPVDQAEERIQALPNSTSLVVSLLHHPFNWFEHTNARRFEAMLDENSDAILTGHEHVSDVFTKDKNSGQNIQYFAGSVLQEPDSKTSAFGLVLIDFDTAQQKIVEYFWEKDHYKPRERSDWIQFNRNRFLQKRGLRNSLGFENYLNDIGTEYTHPFRKKGGLAFDDLFIIPDATEYPYDATVKKRKVIRSEALLDAIIDARYAVIYGEENSGKTALSKMVYRHLKSKELVPILLRPTDGLLDHDEISLRKCLEQAITEQYSQDSAEEIFQLPMAKRALVIDDLHRFQLNTHSRRALLKAAQNMFGTVVVFVTDIYLYQSLIEKSGTSKTAFDYTEFKIREFGRKLRGRLIRRWLQIGREMIVDPKDIAHEEDALEKALNATISRNVIPSYPFWIISILQLWNSEKTTNGNFGAFGYVFDGLIAKQLEDIGYDATHIDKIYTFLGRLAYFLFNRDEPSATLEELSVINTQYSADYKVRLGFTDLISRLQSARVLRESDGNYRFTQPYILYFFVARYIRENIAANTKEIELRNEINHMILHISYEPYSYILLILVYLTKDYELINQIVDQGNKIYAELNPCDLDTSVEFINALNPAIEPIPLPANDVQSQREAYRESIDDADEDEEDSEEFTITTDNDRLVSYSDDLDDLSKMIFGLKSLDLMGQILRNFPGSLYGDMKLKLAEACYLLGLRTLEGFMSLARENVDAFREHYVRVLKERRAGAKQLEAIGAAQAMLVWLAGGASFGIIKRVSTAVGHEDLAETYAEVRKDLKATNAIELIDLSVKLDHFKGIPHAQIKELEKKLQKNKFAYSIERDLVSHFLFLFPVAQRDAQKLTDMFNIEAAQSQLLLSDGRRSRRRKSKSRKRT